MVNRIPTLLCRVKSWQLIGLGFSGWLALYSAAILTWGASSAIIGNAQGGCFAITMTLASIEAKRYKNTMPAPTDPFQWINGITTGQINQIIAQSVQKQEFRVEAIHPVEAGMGFGVRAVNAGRTLVFETDRWQEPVINLLHAQTTEANRRKILADLAIIVGVGTPDEDTQIFVKSHSLQLLAGKEFKDLIEAEKPPAKIPEV